MVFYNFIIIDVLQKYLFEYVYQLKNKKLKLKTSIYRLSIDYADGANLAHCLFYCRYKC